MAVIDLRNVDYSEFKHGDGTKSKEPGHIIYPAPKQPHIQFFDFPASQQFKSKDSTISLNLPTKKEWQELSHKQKQKLNLPPKINFSQKGDIRKNKWYNMQEETLEYKGAGSKTEKFIDNTTDAMTKSERQVVDDLVGQGKTVESIPKDPKAIDKSPDFKIDGVKTELKTLENANTNTGMKRIQEGFTQHAETVIIDARDSGLTSSQATEIINRASGKYPNGQLPGKVEIWIDGQVITYP